MNFYFCFGIKNHNTAIMTKVYLALTESIDGMTGNCGRRFTGRNYHVAFKMHKKKCSECQDQNVKPPTAGGIKHISSIPFIR